MDGKGIRNASLQAVAAVGLTGVVLGGLWGLGQLGDTAGADGKPAVCATPGPQTAAGYPALCAALNRPDLPTLLGTPDDRVSIAQPAPFAFGKDASAEVRLTHSVVVLTASPSLSVEDIADMPQFLPTRTTVLGRPAVEYVDHAMTFGADANGKATTGGGPVVRHLMVAQDLAAPNGPSFEIAVFRQDATSPDISVVRRLGETVLPTLPAWTATP
ncbi:DUF6215 domain-containing protein [Kitasatospora sp. NPDC049285]|uniref:DUF6215 domain-containing protein n=1 Tax=Kitasatospora sp. NPDC049285 TaxID=3157096 RepID=UPI00341ADD18